MDSGPNGLITAGTSSAARGRAPVPDAENIGVRVRHCARPPLKYSEMGPSSELSLRTSKMPDFG